VLKHDLRRTARTLFTVPDRRPILPLPPEVVDRIAAGEVVQRPASVVKELVENALDAGATSITLQIEAGGRDLIRVIDNGRGIPADELPLAFRQHATSKVRDDRELESVATLGFRGEALASIGSVTKSRIVSRTPDGEAFELTCDGGRLGEVRPAAGNVGTTIECRDLFHNTPARRKFLKAAAAESGQVTDVFQRLALPRPEVAFRYERDGKLAADWPATDDPWHRLVMAWPAEYRDRAIRFDTRDGDLRLRGIAGLPEYAATTARYHHLFVNGRSVGDRSLQHAAREAYRGLTEPGRHPAVVLLLDVPPGMVDVNVHPAKSEVRFREPSRLWSMINATLREALLGEDLVPRAKPEPVVEEPRPDVRETLADFFKERLEVEREQTLLDTPEPGDPPPPAAPPPPPAADSPAATTRAMQLHNSYLVVEGDEGMEIIDQHALHERVLYEDLLARVRRGPLESQRMLMPAVAEVSETEVSRLDDLGPLLSRLGIEAEAFGPDAIAVRSFPTLVIGRLSNVDPAAFVAEVLRGESGDDEEAVHTILDLMACKAAVKAGDRLSPDEIDHLMSRRHLTPRQSNCPHGRPTTLRLTLDDLEKQFKRRGF
jgi:DNA mismatch repair protein MutL